MLPIVPMRRLSATTTATADPRRLVALLRRNLPPPGHTTYFSEAMHFTSESAERERQND